jgi:hypothetical protein
MEIELKNKAIKCRSAKPVTSGRRVPASAVRVEGQRVLGAAERARVDWLVRVITRVI